MASTHPLKVGQQQVAALFDAEHVLLVDPEFLATRISFRALRRPRSDVAGVQRPAVRLDRRDRAPFRLLVEALSRRRVGHRQQDSQHQSGLDPTRRSPTPVPSAVVPHRQRRPPVQRSAASIVAAAAERHGVDPDLVHAVIAVESGYRATPQSPVGAQGLMQLMPAT